MFFRVGAFANTFAFRLPTFSTCSVNAFAFPAFDEMKIDASALFISNI